MRPLRTEETQLLELLAGADFEGNDAFRTQIGAIEGVESSCGCGCPSIMPTIDRTRAEPVLTWNSMLPYVLWEYDRPDGLDRHIMAFLDQDGYLSNLECVYADESRDEWPDPARCRAETSMLA